MGGRTCRSAQPNPPRLCSLSGIIYDWLFTFSVVLKGTEICTYCDSALEKTSMQTINSQLTKRGGGDRSSIFLPEGKN